MTEETKTDEQRQAAPFVDIGSSYTDVVLLSQTDRRITLRARDASSSKPVFIKMLSESRAGNWQAVEGFHNERRTLAVLCERLGSKAIPPIVGTGVWRNRPYFAQPLLPGWPLAHAMRKCAAFNVSQSLRLLETCLALLDQIHAAGFIHADISPENILISTESSVRTDGTLPESLSVLIVDFESSRRLRGTENGPGSSLIAKAPYLAPEIASGSPLTVRSDIFALGIVAYELLIGRRPYDVHSLEDVRALSAVRPREMPSLYAIPRLVEKLVREMAEPTPTRRLGTAAEALDRVRELRCLADCLRRSGSPEANAEIRHALTRDAARYVNATTNRGAESDLLERAVLDSVSADTREVFESRIQDTGDTLPGGMLTFRDEMPSKCSDGSCVTGSSRGTVSTEPPIRRKEMTSYLMVPRQDNQGQQQLVDFSVFAPSQIAPGSSFILDVWAYPPLSHEEMLDRAARQRKSVEIGSRGGVSAPLNVGLSMSLKLNHFKVDNPLEAFWWSGQTANVGFCVTAPVDLPPETYAGQVAVTHGGMLIARLLFELVVSDRSIRSEKIGTRELRESDRRVRSAFASYSSKDRPLVVQRVQGMSAVGVDVFLDVLSIRAGQKWEDELLWNIQNRDVFYLFWSQNARNSKYVEREWRFALGQRGIDFIHPIPLADPRQAPPPAELSGLHFRDVYLMCIEQQAQ